MPGASPSVPRASYEEVLDAEPRHPEVLERLATLLHEQGQNERALALARRLRRRDRTAADRLEAEILYATAHGHFHRGESDEARSALKTLVRRHKDHARGWRLLGEVEAERDKAARAIDAWRRALEADPGMGPELYPKLDATYAARSKSGDYEKWLRGRIEAEPRDAGAQIALARSLTHRGETNEALESLARAVEIDPSHAALRVELGRGLLAAGQEAEALKAFASLLDRLEAGGLEAGAGSPGTSDTVAGARVDSGFGTTAHGGRDDGEGG